MKVAVIGSGGREHALAWKLGQSPQRPEVSVLPGNGGTAGNVPIRAEDSDGIRAHCRRTGVDLVVIGPEGPLAAGLADLLRQDGVRVLGPSGEAARLESSKVHAKEFMARYGVATGGFHVAADPARARGIVEAMPAGSVVKYDGLAAGKGVFVCPSVPEALSAVDEVERQYGASAPIVVEELLRGREISIMALTDGTDIRLLPPSQDHKQLLDGDRGPNTGGMGAFCPVPFWDRALQEAFQARIVGPTLSGLQREGLDYRGVLYFGLMVTERGPLVLEYNVRLGDPETEVVLPALDADLLEFALATAEGRLGSCAEPGLHPGCFVDVVMVSGGYPGPYGRGVPIRGLDAVDAGALVFHAGTRRQGGEVLTDGGRVLNVVARGADMDEAIRAAYYRVERISFEGRFFRTDIGRREGTA